MSPEKIYEQVSGSEDTLDHLEEDEKNLPKYRRQNSLRRATLKFAGVIASLVALVTLLFIAVVLNKHAHPEIDPASSILSCGESPEEARAAGCKYDVMMQLWVPPPCYDEVLSERYLATHHFPFFNDVKGQHEIPLETMRLGEHKVTFSSHEYHQYHCFFTWEVMVRAMRTRGYVIEEMMSYDHVMHCHHMTLETPIEKSRLAVEAHSGYARCAKVDTWKEALPVDEMSSVA